ncbi:hypothetical protein MKW98_001959 [Papaver atlanticum]|uniref:Peptidase A1 domain-containing protein n=1 Tax=Papaver atlanticum TaxID=357466 RepID=A0AAD4SMJ0_9MAGN|nr:hypothetical protein MKW98_001959 [Papaver atlanticum]
MDVYIGTPPKQYSLILDTGKLKSYRNISCHDPRCQLVLSPDPPPTCDSVNVTTPTGASKFKAAENVMFCCGHWNRGLFHGASGLLGLGRGPLSFSSQLQSVYGHTFSYCLVDTFYYVKIKSIRDGNEVLEIPVETWEFTTLSYFSDPEEFFYLAILGTHRSSLLIFGNYHQQNFHILYDTKKSRLGFAPVKCDDEREAINGLLMLVNGNCNNQTTMRSTNSGILHCYPTLEYHESSHMLISNINFLSTGSTNQQQQQQLQHHSNRSSNFLVISTFIWVITFGLFGFWYSGFDQKLGLV